MVVHVGGIMDCEWLERDLGKTHGCRVVVLGNSSPVSSGMHRCNSMYDMGLADQSVMYRRNHEYPTRDYGFAYGQWTIRSRRLCRPSVSSEST